jgi:D-beta-D-heptose 7-phosphate kinase/D-beta-D-heptose 1-phosphate adenosyltransferase
VSGGAPLVVVGDVLLDRDVVGSVERLSPDAPVPVVDETEVRARPGGAGLAAALAAADGRPVTLVAALGSDAAGDELRTLLRERGVELRELELDGATPEKVRVGIPGRPLLRLDRGGAAGAVGEPNVAACAAIGWASGVLVSDYGRGVAAQPGIRAALEALDPTVPVVWDPHPRGPEPIRGARLVTPNLAEATRIVSEPAGAALPSVAARARTLARHWHAAAVCVTCGERGAVVVVGDHAPLAVPADPAPLCDACGAGDRFASCAAAALADGASTGDAVLAAVTAASRFVAAAGAAAIAAEAGAPRGAADDDPRTLAASVRAAGGTVVATGGCFDLLHPGHVRMLEAARALGDCLVVCLNSDASVTRLKGPARPVMNQRDRVAVLRALRCVDAVLVFDEDLPVGALGALRPHVWAKGGDYAGRELPEARILRRWGGEAVVLPFLDGKSSTRIIEEVSLRATS